MFPNMSQVSHMVFSMRYKPVWLIEAAPKTFFLFGCLKETLAVSKVLGGFFFSSETVDRSDGSGRKFEVRE